MLCFTKKEKKILEKLNTPSKVQDLLNGFKFNFEKNGETLKSPILTLRARNAHCFEGALLGAYILSLHGFTPYLMHFKVTKEDYDHIVVPFKVNGYWGALSKTNHMVLRYREPVYKNIRELAMSYFHEYFLSDGKKTLRQYSAIFNLNTLKNKSDSRSGSWVTSTEDLWYIDKKLDRIKHYDIIPKSYLKKLRKADKIEIKATKLVDFKKY
ncbi:MAG: hypothetical protein PHT16_03940 [Candidatus Pacebacteria bacterium]|nr:hypothetical protein [Candidatus Paceibacterota bacterium]